jgi:hypothetical protein
MNGCIYQTKDGECELYAEGGKYTAFCDIDNCESKRPSNADLVRAMSDEELAELWWERVDCGECPVHRDCKMTGQDCKRLALDWLRQEATDG